MDSRTVPLPVPMAAALPPEGDAAPPEGVPAVYIGGRGKQAWLQARVFNRLVLVPEAVVSVAELLDAAYGAAPDGGPVAAILNLRITIYRLRRRGVLIDTIHGRGYVLSGFAPEGSAAAAAAVRGRRPRRRGRPPAIARSGRRTAVAAAEVGEERAPNQGAQPEICIAGAKRTG